MADTPPPDGEGTGRRKPIPSDGRSEVPADVLAAERGTLRRRRMRLGRPLDAAPTGLALSGGGIRSASFCLGVLQALQTDGVIDGLDYLSTVSGGGYAGCCMTTCMQDGGAFPFTAPGRHDDTAAVRHVRDFSNYLIPRGGWDVVTAAGLILRGLVANAVLAAPFVLLPAALLVLAYPTPASLEGPGPFGPSIPAPPVPGFPLTTDLAVVAVALLLIWALAKSAATSGMRTFDRLRGLATAELHGPFADAWKCAVVAIAVMAAVELQPLALHVLQAPAAPPGCLAEASPAACAGKALRGWLQYATPALAPLGAVATFLSHRLGRARRVDGAGKPAGPARKALATAALLLAAVVIPSLLWLAMLRMAAWAQGHGGAAAGGWLLVATAAALLLTVGIDPNATSLHRMYRDRLAKAFLFRTDRRDAHHDLEERVPKLHEVDAALCPYPIVNASLNIEGSPYANKRGRNADFFVFTPEYTGSGATGYVGSARMAEWEPKLDLGTAMAISGAAVSPNMGAATIKPLVPTLALLNVRLGYWIANPGQVAGPAPVGLAAAWRRFRRSFLLVDEVLGRITETSPTVYLTDGGNLENLGVYSLMARRCELIIAVDAEADPAMGFGSLLKLERFARSDLGAAIDLPWEVIRDRTLAVDAALAGDAEPVPDGFHAAACGIRYGEDGVGVLLYVKSSLTGDEDDYVLDYKRRNPDFPHETTNDQFFGEEQLEAYRALGFHAARGLVAGATRFAVAADHGRDEASTRAALLERIRTALGLVRPDADPPTGSAEMLDEATAVRSTTSGSVPA